MTPLTDINVAYPSRLAAVNEGPRRGLLVTHDHYQNTTFFEQINQPGTGPVFSNFSKAQSVSAPAALSDQSWPSACDWDGDGDLDVLVGGGYGLPRILINEGTPQKMMLSEAQHIFSQGEPIRITRNQVFGTENWHDMGYSYPVLTDWDNDGLPDLMMPNETNRIFWYKNIGTRAEPEFGEQLQVICDGYPDSPTLRALSASRADDPNYPNNPYPYESEQPFFWRTGVAFADWNGDWLMDILACTEWSVYPFYGHNAIEMSQHPSYTISAASQLEIGSSRSYSVDWNSDPGVDLGGWTDTSNGQLHSADMQWVANGGVDDLGHLMAYRSATYLPYMVTGRDQVQSETCGNLYAKFGPEIDISLDVKLDTGDPSDETGYGWWIYDDNSAVWYKNLDDPGGAPTNWTHYEETISTTWTDTEAAAHGWHSFNSSRSWSELMQNVTQWNFMGRALNYYGGSDYTGHLDNFLMESTYTPLPGDANRDGTVDNTDAMILASNWLRKGSNVYWQDGDFNADGIVGDKDATLLASNWGFAINTSADVPEPSYGVLLIMLLASASILRNRFNPLDITSNKGLPR